MLGAEIGPAVVVSPAQTPADPYVVAGDLFLDEAVIRLVGVE